jgi:hypothetical protein
MRTDTAGLLADAVRGALAGALASKAMGQVTSFMYSHQDEEATKREREARGGKQAFGVAAEKMASLVGRQLDDEQREKMGMRLHWATALGAGAVYALLRRRVPSAGLGVGLLFGAAFWLVVDEWMNPAFGFTPGPRAFPWQAHARGLAGHLTYGLATELQLRTAERALR